MGPIGHVGRSAAKPQPNRNLSPILEPKTEDEDEDEDEKEKILSEMSEIDILQCIGPWP